MGIKVFFIFFVLMTGLFAKSFQFPEIDHWQKADTVTVYSSSNLWERINGAADLFLNYGFQELFAADLHKEDIGLALEIYDMGTPLNAFGIYNTEAPGKKKKLKIGTEAVLTPPSQGFLLKGRYYVKLDVFEGKMSEKDGEELLAAVDAVLAGSNALPEEFSMLPKKNRVPGSYTYIKSGFQGLTELENCLSAEYKENDNSLFKYFVIVSEIDDDSKNLLQNIVNKWQSVEDSGNRVFYREIPYKGFIGVAVVGDRIIGVTDSDNLDIMLKRFNPLFMEKSNTQR